MADLKNKTIILTGASRGIGKAMAVKFAQDGANIVAAAKTLDKHPKLPGSLEETVRAVEKAGGRAKAVKMDVRFPEQVQRMVDVAVETFGGIDVLVNNAGAISLTPIEKTSVKLFDRMHAVNDRAVYLCALAALPYLKKASNPHILNLSPPLNLDPVWLKDFGPYTRSKYGMSLLTIAMAAEFKKYGIRVNSLWPRTIIATAAIEFAVGNKEMLQLCRKPSIVADAARILLKNDDEDWSGRLFLDEEVLKTTGIEDFADYAVSPKMKNALRTDLYI